MSKARTLANLISDNAELADGQISVAEVVGAAPTANPTFTGNIDAGDNVKIRLGDSDDLQIYHDGSNSYIKDAGTGNLRINADDFTLTNAANNSNLISTFNGEVYLYNNSNVKLLTTSTGISVTGNATFANNGKAIFGDGSGLQIYNTGGASVIQDSGNGSLFLQGESQIVLGNVGNAESYAVFNQDGAVELRYNNLPKLATTSTGVSVTGSVAVSDGIVDTGQGGSATVFNQSGSTADFRVESSGSEHMLFVDGGTNRVGINNSNPANTLDVTGSILGSVGFSSVTPQQTTGTPFGSAVGGGPNSTRTFIVSPPSEKQSSAIKLGGGNTGGNNSSSWISSQYTGAYASDIRLWAPRLGNHTYGDTDATNVFNARESETNFYSQNEGSSGTIFRTLNLNRSTGVIFNPDTHSTLDFRVASNSNTNMLFVDAGNDRIGINDSSPAHKLSIVGGGSTSSAIEICGTTNNSSQNDNATISSPFSMNFQVNNQTSGNQSGRAFVFRSGGAGYSDGTALFSIAEGVTSAQGNRIVSSEFSFNGGGTQTVLTPARGESWLLFAALQNYGTGDTRHGGLAIVSRTSQGNDETLLSTIIELDSTGLFAVSGSNVTYNGSGGNPYTAISMLRLT